MPGFCRPRRFFKAILAKQKTAGPHACCLIKNANKNDATVNQSGNSFTYTCSTRDRFHGYVGLFVKQQFFKPRVEINETGMVEKITSMGKLELVKYTMKDIVEQKEIP